MRVIPPLEITTSRLTSSNAAETHSVYSAGTTYALGACALDADGKRIYESLASGNVGNPLTDVTKWLDIGPSNKWAMFDLLRNTATSRAGSITVVVTPGVRVDSLALLGMVASEVEITITSGGTEVYSYTENLNTREVACWYDYFFRAFSTKQNLVLFDLPPYTNAIITIVLTATSGNAECGACVVGTQEDIGRIQYDAVSDVLNFSTVDRDFAGGVNVMVQRRNVPKAIGEIWLDKSRVNRARALRDSINGTPAVWSGIEDSNDGYFESLLILGFYRKFSINLKFPQHAVISLELEEI